MTPARQYAVLGTVVAFCTASIIWLDRPLALALQSPPPWGHGLAAWLSAVGAPVFWYLLAVVGLGPGWHLHRRGNPLGRHVIVGSVALLATWVVVTAVKIGLGRPRPPVFLESGLYGFTYGGMNSALKSFPSGHAAGAFVVATVLGWHLGRAKPLLLAVATAIALSRLVLGLHFLADIVAGAYLGLLVPEVVRRRLWAIMKIRER